MKKISSMAGVMAIVSLAVLGACTAPAQPRGSSTGDATSATAAFVDDATITTNVKAGLVKDQKLQAFDIHVETQDRVVQLSGFVSSPVQKTDAQRIASNVQGVKEVKNNIIVQ